MITLLIESTPRGVRWAFDSEVHEEFKIFKGTSLLGRCMPEENSVIWTSGYERLTAFEDDVVTIEELWIELLEGDFYDIQKNTAKLIDSIATDVEDFQLVERVVFAMPESTSELAQNSLISELSKRFSIPRDEVFLLWRSVAIALSEKHTTHNITRRLILDFGHHKLEGSTLDMSWGNGVHCPVRDFNKKRILGVQHTESLTSWLRQNYRLVDTNLDLVKSDQGSAVFKSLDQDLNFDPPELWKSSSLNYEPIIHSHDDFAKPTNLNDILSGIVSEFSILESNDVALWFGWPVYWHGEDHLRTQIPTSKLLENDAVLQGCKEFASRLRRGLPTYFELIPSYEIWCQSAELGMPKKWGWETLLKGKKLAGTETLRAEPNERFQLNAGTSGFDMNVRAGNSDHYRFVMQELPVQIATNEPILIKSEIRPTGGSVKFSITSRNNPDLFGQNAEVALRWDRSEEKEVANLIPPILELQKFSYPFIIQSEGDSNKRYDLQFLAESIYKGQNVENHLHDLFKIVPENLYNNDYVVPFGNRQIRSGITIELEYLIASINNKAKWYIQNILSADRNSKKWIRIVGSLYYYASEDIQNILFSEIVRRDFPLAGKINSLWWNFGRICRKPDHMDAYLRKAISAWENLQGLDYFCIFWPFAKSLCCYGETARIPRKTAFLLYEHASVMLDWLINDSVPTIGKPQLKNNWQKWTLQALLFGLRIREIIPEFLSLSGGPEEEKALASLIRNQLRIPKIRRTPIPPKALKGLNVGPNPPTLGDLVLRFLEAQADETDLKLAGGIGLSS